MLVALGSRLRSRLVAVPVLAGAALLVATACSSSSSSQAAPAAASGSSSTSTAASGSSDPSTMFSTASVSGLGTVVVDAKGHTVYVLTADGHTNVPCEDSTGCTKIWPDLPFPGGTTSANAGTGVQASLLGSMKQSDGETYPTYHGWLMYEYVAHTGPAQGHGEGVKSFGGTWYALDASGNLVMPSGAGSTATTAATSGASAGGY
jgi:predicted lipoprotein with Yx(FWY)xxD motif